MGKVGLINEARNVPARPDGGVVVGLVVGFDDGRPKITYPDCGDPDGVVALAVTDLSPSDIGVSVVVAFEVAEPRRAIILGKLQPREKLPQKEEESDNVSVKLDGQRLELSAEREIVLKCGKASITLTRAGKVIIKGAYLSQRSSGVNKIKGASVQIN